jgi:hypothetical protein
MWDNNVFRKIQLTWGTHKSATTSSANDAPKREHEMDAVDRIKIESGGQKNRVMEPCFTRVMFGYSSIYCSVIR